MIPLSSTGEIASFQDVDQFQPAKTQFACGFFACSIVKSMAPVGHAPTQTVAQMIAEAEQWYAQYDGNNSISNTDGMTLQQLYKLLAQIGLHFVPASLDIATLRAWLRLGYPILIAGLETTFFDMGLGDVVPYPWQPSGNHIIVLTGVTADGNFLVRDSANVTNLYNSTTLRPGPRKYDAAKMRLVSATVVVPPWLPVPPAGFDPAKEQFVPIIPAGWHDDGNTLTAPNGHKVVHGFREYVLKNNWPPANMPLQEEIGHNPLEESNPSLGGGTQQVFRWTMLEWTPSRGVFIAWIGQEFLKIRSDNTALQAQVAGLETRLKACTSSH
ncbi:MAG TPA: hypothetical protein VKV20_13795 [Ktedonobacteraceae bacterium]|nr:hypothetical protein [Ktedonobacteraceae bacterium]